MEKWEKIPKEERISTKEKGLWIPCLEFLQFWQKLDKSEVTLKLGYFSTAKTIGALDSACHLAYQIDHHALSMGYLLSLGMLKPLCPFLTYALLAGNTDCL